MGRFLPLLLVLGALLALPFLLRPAGPATDWMPGDAELVVITPHNAAIRSEFGRAFSEWHEARYGRPVQVDWVVIGGTSEIGRFLPSEFAGAVRAWWRERGRDWPAGATEALFGKTRPESEELAALWEAYRATDDPQAFSSGIDLFFGGGEYDFRMASEQGLLVEPWPAGPPPGLFATPGGRTLIPERVSGETWCSSTFFGSVLTTFGISFNRDRLRERGLPVPSRWIDLTDPGYRGQLGLADPTKSGSSARAFDLMIQERMRAAVLAAGFTPERIGELEGGPPEARPALYEETLAAGWRDGVRMIQLLGANARYFTAASQRVPFEVGMGEVAAGICVDFYGRFQAQFTPGAGERVGFVAPVGGTAVTSDPIGLLRGAPHRELAVRFLEFTLGEDGQRLWCYRPGEPGGPQKYALRRLPIRRDFYPAEDPEFRAAYERHARHYADPLGDPAVNAYALSAAFTTWPRWTGAHFAAHRDLVRAMCMDSATELKTAWDAIVAAGPAVNPAALEALARLPDRPEPLNWQSAPTIYKNHRRLDLLREWTACFRANYREARALAEGTVD
ncbi:MAG: ABC transporter substrate-binding protein [Planctomycetota bacterium]|nr:MAG: ABC transporter substrate-binding protein [Planctomycetota bacterium]